MELKEFIARLTSSLSELCKLEHELLTMDVHEEAIAHSFIKYLSKYFGNLNLSIDPSWDKRIIDGVPQKKMTDFLISQIPLRKRNVGIPIDDEYIRKEVLPDVIIHNRTDNNYNFLAIEVKKSTNKTPRDYDMLKLSVYTGGDLNYQFGAFIEFYTGADYNNKRPFSYIIYKEGMPI